MSSQRAGKPAGDEYIRLLTARAEHAFVEPERLIRTFAFIGPSQRHREHNARPAVVALGPKGGRELDVGQSARLSAYSIPACLPVNSSSMRGTSGAPIGFLK